MYTKGLFVALCAAIVLTVTVPALGQAKPETKTKKVTVKGVAGGEDANARDKALMDAYRKAIEQGVGTFIQSQTEVENYAVIYDKIISNTEGYIDEYKVVKEGIDNPGTKKAMTWVIIEAVVKLGELKDDWKTLAFLIKKKGNPKIMVVVRDKIDGKVLKGGADRSSVVFEKFLLEKNIRPVDKATMEENKLNDIKAASLEGNLAKVAALGKEYRANLVVIGYADATFSERSEPYKGAGVWYFYSGSMVYKVIRTDDAQIIHSDQISSERKTRGTDKSKLEAANKALVNTAKVGASKILTGLMKAWNKDITIGSEITLTIQGVTFGKIRRIQKALEKIRFVSEVTRDSFSSGVVKFRVKTRYDCFRLADMLVEKDICKDYQIMGASKNTIDVDLNQKEDE
jgi:hypothetical protein